MKIFGVAILAASYFIGQFLGEGLGQLVHLNKNLGGVGFAMLILVISNDYFQKKNLIPKETEQGITFWSSLYIPAVVAMSATSNVKNAVSNFWVAILVGIIATVCCYLLIPVFAKFSKKYTN